MGRAPLTFLSLFQIFCCNLWKNLALLPICSSILKIIRILLLYINFIRFKYKATDGAKKTGQALVKSRYPVYFVALHQTSQSVRARKSPPHLLMSEGARCTGCSDVTPKFDLRKIPSKPVAGTCYPYTITCINDLGCTATKIGIVNIEQSCGFVSEPTIFTNPIENCPDLLPTEEQIMASAGLECTCPDSTPVTTDRHWIGEDENGVVFGDYTATCGSEECGSSVTGQFVTIVDCDMLKSASAPIAQNL